MRHVLGYLARQCAWAEGPVGVPAFDDTVESSVFHVQEPTESAPSAYVAGPAQVEAGSTAVVIGAGGVGQAIIAGLKLVGARRIIVLDPSTERRSIATEFGATSVIDGRDPDRFDLVHSVTDGEGADYVFDAIGISTVTSDTLRYLKNGGAAVLVGMPAHDDQLTVDHWPLVYKGQRILGCNYGSSRPQVDFVKIAGLYLAGQLPLNDMVGERIRQADIPDAIRALSAASGKRAIVRFGSE